MGETITTERAEESSSIETRIASREREILDLFNRTGERLPEVWSPAPGNFNFLVFGTDQETSEEYTCRANSRNQIEWGKQGEGIVRFWPLDAHMTFDYSKEAGSPLDSSQDLVIQVGVELAEDFRSGMDVSTDKPIKEFAVCIYGKEAGRQVTDFPQTPDPLSHTSETNPKYREAIDDDGRFVVKVDLTGEEPKVTQYKGIIEVKRKGEENYHEGGTEFGLQAVDFAIEAARRIADKAYRLDTRLAEREQRAKTPVVSNP